MTHEDAALVMLLGNEERQSATGDRRNSGVVVLVAVEMKGRFGSWLAWEVGRGMVSEGREREMKAMPRFLT